MQLCSQMPALPQPLHLLLWRLCLPFLRPFCGALVVICLSSRTPRCPQCPQPWCVLIAQTPAVSDFVTARCSSCGEFLACPLAARMPALCCAQCTSMPALCSTRRTRGRRRGLGVASAAQAPGRGTRSLRLPPQRASPVPRAQRRAPYDNFLFVTSGDEASDFIRKRRWQEPPKFSFDDRSSAFRTNKCLFDILQKSITSIPRKNNSCDVNWTPLSYFRRSKEIFRWGWLIRARSPQLLLTPIPEQGFADRLEAA